MCEREFEQQMRKATNTHKCLFRLRNYCVIMADITPQYGFGTQEFIQLYCSMCVKVTYAKAKNRKLQKFSVVNTL